MKLDSPCGEPTTFIPLASVYAMRGGYLAVVEESKMEDVDGEEVEFSAPVGTVFTDLVHLLVFIGGQLIKSDSELDHEKLEKEIRKAFKNYQKDNGDEDGIGAAV